MSIALFSLVHMLWNLWIIYIFIEDTKIYIWYAQGKIYVCVFYIQIWHPLQTFSVARARVWGSLVYVQYSFKDKQLQTVFFNVIMYKLYNSEVYIWLMSFCVGENTTPL
jgi:hypothetical protein